MTGKKELKEYKTVQLWLADVIQARTGSEKTQKLYTTILQQFSEFAKKDPDELVTDARRSKLEQPEERNCGELLMGDWFKWLVTEGKYSRMYAKTCYGAIRSFYRSNNIRFMGKTPPATPKTRRPIPDKETLQKAWRLATPTTRMRVGILNDTGMRPEDAVKLSYGDIKKSLDGNKDRIYIERVGKKEGVEFHVCLSRPVTELVYQHIKDREKKGESMTDETPLMTRSKEPGKPITGNMLWREVKGFGEKVGANISPRTFRKRFRTQGSPIVGQDAICAMGGWKLQGVGDNYYLPNEDDTRKLYAKLEEALCLEEPRDNRNMEAQREMAANVLRAAGLDPDRMLREACVGARVDEQAAFLTKTMVGVMQGNGTNTAERIGAMIADAITYAKKVTETAH
jgi:integrase